MASFSGSGTGLVGLSAALLQPAEVVLTDLPKLMPGLKQNIQINELGGSARAVPLQWGAAPLPDAIEAPFDLVVASDVIYKKDSIGPLTDTLLALTAEHSRIVLSYELRAGTTDWAQRMRERGLSFMRVPHEDLHPHWRADDIGVFIGRRVGQPTAG